MKSGEEEQNPLWERQNGETSLRYAAFCRYRDMGPEERSLAKVAKELAPAKTMPKVCQLKDWSAQDRWQIRVKAWDDEQDRIKRAYMEKALKGMARKHLDIAITLQGKALKRLQSINLDLDPEALTVMEAVRILNDAIRLERVVLGEPTDILRHTENLKVTQALFLDEMEEEEAKIALSNYSGTLEAQRKTEEDNPSIIAEREADLHERGKDWMIEMEREDRAEHYQRKREAEEEQARKKDVVPKSL